MELFYKIRSQARENVRIYFLYMVVLYAASLPLSMAGMEIFGWVTFLLFFMLYFERKDLELIKTYKTQIYLVLGFILHTLVSAGLNSFGDKDIFIRIFGESRFLLLFLMWVIVLSRVAQKMSPLIIKTLVTFAFLGGVYCVAQTYTGFKFPSQLPDERTFNVAGQVLYRGSGFFQTPLTFAHSYGLVFIFLFALWSKKSTLLPKNSFISIFAQGLGILHTFTRGVWLAVFGSMITVAATLGRKIAIGSITAALAIVLIAINVSPVFKSRLVSITDFKADGVVTRLDLWKANWHMAVKNPIFGVGLSENHLYLKSTYEELGIDQNFISHAHNNILEVLGGAGFLGALILLTLYGTIVIRLKKINTPLAIAALLVVLQLFLSGFVEANYFDDEVNHMFHFLLALGLAQNENKS